MRCPGCDHVSLGLCCSNCGRCEVPQAVAFSPFDLLDPINLGRELGNSGVNPLDPINTGRTLGQGIQSGTVLGGVKGATSAISDLASVVKWIMVGGAVVVGGVLVYSVVKFIPKMAEAAAANVKEAGRVGGQIASRSTST